MYPAVRCYHFQQAVGIGGFEFCQHTVFQYLADYRVLVPKLLQNIRIGAPPGFCLFPRWQHKLLEEDFTKLFRRIDIELVSGVCPYPGLQLRNAVVQALAEIIQCLAVHVKTGDFHIRKYSAQRQLDLVIQLCHAELIQL